MSRNSPAPDANEHSSPPASLSPLSSRFAAEAEKETIRRLRQECRGLATALGHLMRSTKEWALIKSKLDIANEELACVLEDRTLFRSFTGDGNDVEIESDEDEQSFPTPPLGSKQQAVGCDELASRIRTPPLMAKPDAEIVDRGIAAPEPPLAITGPKADDTPEKYSLEWFSSRMKDDTTQKQGDALNPLPDEGTAELSISYDNSKHHSKSESSASVIEETNGDSGNLDIDDLSATLKTVPKFSLEWFEIRQAITDQRIQQQQSDEGNFAVKSQSSASSLARSNEQSGVIGHLNRKLGTVPRYSSEWFEIRQSINDLRIQQQNDGCYSNLASACACNPSGGNRGSSPEQRLLHLTEQLESFEKYSLNWFQAKKEIEALTRLGDLSRRKPP